jgi:hypothetical protein
MTVCDVIYMDMAHGPPTYLALILVFGWLSMALVGKWKYDMERVLVACGFGLT